MGQKSVESFYLLLLLLLWTSIAVATETLYPPSCGCDCEPPVPPSNGCIGAVYFATNDILGNWVIINCIQPNGTLLFNNTISTRGNGSSHVNQYLFVNYMITGDIFLFVANSGSNSVSMFNIDPQSPEKLTFIKSVNSQGDFPACLAYSAALKLLCVLNIGLTNNVACFKVTPTCLTPLPTTIKPVGKSQPYPPSFEESPTDIIFSADSKKVIVSVRGRTRIPKIPAVLAVFHVSSQGTVLSDPIMNPIHALNPIELTLLPSTMANCYKNNQQPMVYTSSTPTGLGLFTVPSSGIIDQRLIVNESIPWNLRAGWSKFSTETGRLYTTDDAKTGLTETIIKCSDDGKLTGIVLWPYPLHEAQSEFLFASIPSGEYLYSMISRRGGLRPIIQVFRMSRDWNKNATPIQSYAPESGVISAQTGQSLQIFCQGIATFVAQPQDGADGPPQP